MNIADQSDADSTDRRSLRSQQLMIDALVELLAVKAYRFDFDQRNHR